MGNIIRMNLFRLKKTRLAYVMAAMTLGLTLLFFGLEWLISSTALGSMDGINMPAGWEPPGTNVWGVIRSAMAYGAIPMGAVMGCLLFFVTEISTGYVKNLVGYEADKRRLAGANLLTAALYTGVLTAATVLFLFLMTVISYKKLEFDGAGKFLVWLLVAYIEVLAYVMLMQLLSDATGKAVPFLILGAMYAIVAMSMYQMIDLAVMFLCNNNEFFGTESFAVEKYTLLGGLTSYKLSAEWKSLLLYGVIAAAVLAGAYFLDVVALRKREIK